VKKFNAKNILLENALFTYLWRRIHEDLGLSEYQAKVYITLVISGQSKARDISQMSGVPRTKVYETLKNLIDRGLVKELPTNPLKFIASSPIKSFRENLQPLEEKTRNLRKLLHTLEFYHHKAKDTASIEQTDVWILREPEVLKKLKSILYEAQKSVMILTSSSGLIFLYRSFSKILDRTAEKGVKVKILTPKDSYSYHAVKEFAYLFEVKCIDFKLPVLYVCADWKESLLIKHEHQRFSIEIGILSGSSNLSRLLFQILSENIYLDKKDSIQTVWNETVI